MTEEAIPDLTTPDLTTLDLTTPDFLPLDEIARVVPEARVVAEAAARRISALPAHAVAALKRVLARAPGGDLEGAMALETEATLAGFLHPETAAISARFGQN